MSFNDKNDGRIIFNDLITIYNSVDLIREPKIPFPQANNFELFLEICETLFMRGQLSRNEIMEIFDIQPRGYSFYKSAGEYLGLFENNKSNSINLSQKGLGIFDFDEKNKKLSIIYLILQHKPFHDVFSIYVKTKRIPNNEEIFEILKKNEIYNINSDVTLKRRSSTVYQWIKWIVNLVSNECVPYF